MGDTQNAQKEIFGKIQGFMAFIDATEQKKLAEKFGVQGFPTLFFFK